MHSMINRDEWPVPDGVKGASARDAFLWYICQAWPKFFGGDEEIENILDHDFGMHILQRGEWELRLRNTKEFPDDPGAVPRENEPISNPSFETGTEGWSKP